MAYLIVVLAAFATALLTLFSGFGLGSLLLPVFALFFALPVAVAATAVVHWANNLFKLGLFGKYARRDIVLAFGLPAAASAFAGAWVLARLAPLAPITDWTLGGHRHDVTPVGLVLGITIAVFAILELSPRFAGLAFDRRWIPWGGVLSGFFGGLSGHQGALRAAFLSRSGLDRDAFLGTSIACAVIVDTVRLLVYGASFFGGPLHAVAATASSGLVVTGTIAAFAGSFVGARLVRKVTLRTLQRCVGVGLLMLAVAIAVGLV
jgi:uncharacterized membrane protein YfcA